MIKLIISLVALMVANILLGTSLASLKLEFDKETFKKGVFKAIFIILAISLMYLCSYLSPDIMVAEINGLSVNLFDGMNILFTAGIVLYGCKCLKNLANLINVKANITEYEENDPEEDEAAEEV